MKRFVRSVNAAFRGIMEAFGSERNLKIHAAAMVIALLLGVWLDIDRWEWVAVLVCIALVISLEMVNTAIELTMDHVHPEVHERVRLIKDISAGAVLFSSVISLVIGMIIFLPRLWALCSGYLTK